MPSLSPRHIQALQGGLDEAVRLFQQLGYTEQARELDLSYLALEGFRANRLVRAGQRAREGYAVLFLETDQRPRSLASIGKRLMQQLHDHPLAVIGVGEPGHWHQVILLRPRVVRMGERAAYKVAKLEISLDAPTWHDVDVLEQLAWDDSQPNPQQHVDRAFDIEAVSQKFFRGLREHYQRLAKELKTQAKQLPHVHVHLKQAGGADRLAIRTICQLLFCWFLQRKGLLAGDRNYLLTRWQRRRGPYYATELEPLFYETLAVPVERRRAGLPGPEIPFLNGGLFHRSYGDISLDLNDSLFNPDKSGLLAYFSRWTFTISEDAPDEVNVAVDPELLGRVFENLISDDEQKRHGVVYTPRPVVQFMCREALVAWLETELGLPEAWCRRLLVDEDPLTAYAQEYGAEAAVGLAERLVGKLEELRVIDPAVGSGAFLLGMLSEIVRLRSLIHRTIEGHDPDLQTIWTWKLRCIERNLLGVDIEPLALELCRLRLWLSLVADLPDGRTPPPLPNLEYRTVAADSLTDIVAGIRMQDTRAMLEGRDHILVRDFSRVLQLRQQYFYTSDPEQKEHIRAELEAEENRMWEEIFYLAERQPKRNLSSKDRNKVGRHIEQLRQGLFSQDRVHPVFTLAFHAPDVIGRGGWDIVIMNPPYLGKKEVDQRVEPGRKLDYVTHHGEKNDLMILFGYRARELAKPGGVCCVIFQDTIFTSADGTRFRRILLSQDELLVVARTKCFEGRAINGAVLVWRRRPASKERPIRWIEGYRRDPRELLAASSDMSAEDLPVVAFAGTTEIFLCRRSPYEVIPSRPLFRPSKEALHLLDVFRHIKPEHMLQDESWDSLSDTRRLRRSQRELAKTGWYKALRPGEFVPLGLCVEGGQGLATAEDRRFLAVIDDTPLAAACREKQEKVVSDIVKRPHLGEKYVRLARQGLSTEEILLRMWDDIEDLLPERGLIRTVPRRLVRTTPLTEEELRSGIRSGPYFVRFEKGDRSEETETGHSIGAAWWRADNPIVIDWSVESVSLLRARARANSDSRRPYFRNEHLWGKVGVTWNTVGSYLRARLVPEGSIFGHTAPTIVPIVEWLDIYTLLALLNADVIDFIVRTFLGTRMHIEVGDVRRVPIPVLSKTQSQQLSELGRRAVEATQASNFVKRRDIEREINEIVRDLYGIPKEADLWVVR